MLNFRRSDPERQRTKGTVGRCVTVTANDRQSWEGNPQFRSDHVDDPLLLSPIRENRYPKLRAIPIQRRKLLSAQRRLVNRSPIGRNVVVGGSERQIGPAHWSP